MTTGEIIEVAKLSKGSQTLLTGDIGPSRFIQLLEQRGLFNDAIQFLAHGLPIEIGIRWGCSAIRELALSLDSTEALEAAENWLKKPGDEERWKAREAAEKSGLSSPADLLGMAVFFSGGSITPMDSPAAPPPIYVANRLVGGSVQLAVLSRNPEQSHARYLRALQIGRQVVKG